jgi:hypothetical protein
MKQGSSQNLANCSFSRHCIHFIDELDTFYFLPHKGPVISLEQPANLDESFLLEQLRAHIPTCSICTATLTRARRLSVKQRSMLRRMLAENERMVPSTSGRILEKVRLKPR